MRQNFGYLNLKILKSEGPKCNYINFKVQTINIKKSRDYTVILTNLWNIKFENLNLKILTDEGPKCYFKNLKEKTINIKKSEDEIIIFKNLLDKILWILI